MRWNLCLLIKACLKDHLVDYSIHSTYFASHVGMLSYECCSKASTRQRFPEQKEVRLFHESLNEYKSRFHPKPDPTSTGADLGEGPDGPPPHPPPPFCWNICKRFIRKWLKAALKSRIPAPPLSRIWLPAPPFWNFWIRPWSTNMFKHCLDRRPICWDDAEPKFKQSETPYISTQHRLSATTLNPALLSIVGGPTQIASTFPTNTVGQMLNIMFRSFSQAQTGFISAEIGFSGKIGRERSRFITNV